MVGEKEIRNGVMSLRQQEMLDAFVRHRNLVDAGREIGVSRERIRQVVMRFLFIPEVAAARLYQKTPLEKRLGGCLRCKRSFTEAIRGAKHFSRGICQSCYNLKMGHSKGVMQVYLHCIQCKRKLVSQGHPGSTWENRRVGGGLCGKCRSQTPGYRERQNRWMREHKRDPRKGAEYTKRWREKKLLEDPDYFNRMHRNYYLANKEKYRKYYKERKLRLWLEKKRQEPSDIKKVV